MPLHVNTSKWGQTRSWFSINVQMAFSNLNLVRPFSFAAFHLTGKHPYYILNTVDPLFDR